MSMTMEQVATHNQQELLTLRAQVAAASGLADAVRATISRPLKFGKTLRVSSMRKASVVRRSSLAVRKISNSGRRRRRHSSLVWSRSLRWCWSGPLNSRRKSRQSSLIGNFCRSWRIRNEECKTWSSCCSRCAQHSWLSRVVRRMTLSPTRGRIRWRHGGDYRSDMIRRQEEESETFCARSFLLDDALFWNSKRGSNAGSPTFLATRRRWRVSWTTISSLLVLSRWCRWSLRNIWFSTRIASDHRIRAMGVLSAAEHIFNEIAMHARAQASNRMAKAHRASHGPRVSPHPQATARVNKIRENPKENFKEPKVRTKVPKAYTKAKHRKLVSEVWNLEIGCKLGHSGICTDMSHWHFLERLLELWRMERWLEFWRMEWWPEFCWMARSLGINVWHFCKLIFTWRFGS